MKHHLVDWGKNNLRFIECTVCDEKIGFDTEKKEDDEKYSEFVDSHYPPE